MRRGTLFGVVHLVGCKSSRMCGDYDASVTVPEDLACIPRYARKSLSLNRELESVSFYLEFEKFENIS